MSDMRNRDRGRGRPDSPPPPRSQEEKPHDPGAYIGRKPERATETIPGGVGRGDVRVSAVGTQPAPVRGDTDAPTGAAPGGHREGPNAADDSAREAGQDR